MKDLNEIRLGINEIDKELTALLERRMAAAGMVGEYKKANNMPVFDAVREAEVIKRNGEMVENQVLRPYVEEMFRRIMDVSKDYQKVILGE